MNKHSPNVFYCMALTISFFVTFSSSLKRILVTGGNKGIGEAICKKLLTNYEDTHVVLSGRNNAKVQATVERLVSELGDNFRSRVEGLEMDVTSEKSVQNAAVKMRQKYATSTSTKPFYGIVNNAGIGFGYSLKDTIETNMFGPKRVTESFLPLIESRIVNIASASGPLFLARANTAVQKLFTDPNTSWESLNSLIEEMIVKNANADAYGFSKACLNLYTLQSAVAHPELIINSCSPGYILTDLTRGMGATNPPEKGTVAPLFCLFADANSIGTGRYYGSDAVRSPLDRYRGPGDPPYHPN